MARSGHQQLAGDWVEAGPGLRVDADTDRAAAEAVGGEDLPTGHGDDPGLVDDAVDLELVEPIAVVTYLAPEPAEAVMALGAGTTWDALTVTRVDFDTIGMGGASYLAALFHLQIVGTGA